MTWCDMTWCSVTWPSRTRGGGTRGGGTCGGGTRGGGWWGWGGAATDPYLLLSGSQGVRASVLHASSTAASPSGAQHELISSKSIGGGAGEMGFPKMRGGGEGDATGGESGAKASSTKGQPAAKQAVHGEHGTLAHEAHPDASVSKSAELHTVTPSSRRQWDSYQLRRHGGLRSQHLRSAGRQGGHRAA